MPAPYDKIASKWESLRKDFRPGEKEYFDILLESLASDSLILDLGCGTGIPNASLLSKAGHRIHGIDASIELLEIARRKVPGAHFELGQIEDETPLPGPFDAAICWDAIFHIDRKRHEPIFRRVADALRPGAIFLMTSGGSANDPFTDTMFGERFSYDAHPPEETERLLIASGFEIVRCELLELPQGGRNKGRLGVAAKKLG